MSIVIHHNPDCGTSRKVLEIVRSTGVEPTVIEYLDEGWTRPQLLALFAAAGLTPSTALRTKRSPAEELGLLEEGVEEEVILEQMLEHPVLVNRPIVCSPKGVRLCRPAESVVPLLDPPPGWQLETSEAELDGTSPTVEAASLVPDLHSLPGLDHALLERIDGRQLAAADDPGTPPKILVLYGSNRERSYSRFVAHEVIRLLHYLGAEARLFDPRDLPLPDSQDADHPKVVELRDLATWSEGMVWISPERHGAMTSVLKAQIDWIPLSLGGVRPTQGKTLAVFQVCGGSQSFNTVNQMRILGRWMRMVTIPNQSSVPKAFLEFDDAGRMTPSPYYRRIVDVVEELVRFTYLVRGRSETLLDRYSERVESHAELSRRVNQKEL